MSVNLIPSNEEQIQKDIENIGSLVLEKLDTSKLNVNPLECDESLLPHLAFIFDVDIKGLSVSQIRTHLQNSRETKKRTGTVYAVNLAASTIFKDEIKVIPWNEFGGVAGTYKFEIDSKEVQATCENIEKTIALVNDAKRHSTHLSGITIKLSKAYEYKVSSSIVSNETTSIYPQDMKDIEIRVNEHLAIGVYIIEKVVLKPQV